MERKKEVKMVSPSVDTYRVQAPGICRLVQRTPAFFPPHPPVSVEPFAVDGVWIEAGRQGTWIIRGGGVLWFSDTSTLGNIFLIIFQSVTCLPILSQEFTSSSKVLPLFLSTLLSSTTNQNRPAPIYKPLISEHKYLPIQEEKLKERKEFRNFPRVSWFPFNCSLSSLGVSPTLTPLTL